MQIHVLINQFQGHFLNINCMTQGHYKSVAEPTRINQKYANSNAKKPINFITFNAFITLNIIYLLKNFAQ